MTQTPPVENDHRSQGSFDAKHTRFGVVRITSMVEKRRSDDALKLGGAIPDRVVFAAKSGFNP